MSTISRRRMFGFLAAGPVAARAAAQEAAARLARVSIGAGLADTPYPSTGRYADKLTTSSRPFTRIAMQALGIPGWLRRQWARESRHVSRIEPEIASLRSVSLVGKVGMQRQRNLALIERHFWEQFKLAEDSDKRRAWCERTGMWF